jgi:diaminohydroxyphosphoribosylaminopyrimidine deaminase/5-amino-6-(5-phosphoribosylamino)uracil reductase
LKKNGKRLRLCRAEDIASEEMIDRDYMDRALQLAERGRGRTSPNPLVGAVVVSRDGVVVGQGFHRRVGEAHAETIALDEAGEHAQGATLYCTLEPCCHRGRTGPCVERIVSAGISRVVAAVRDPNPLVSGKGFDYLRAHGIAVDVGVAAQEASRLNQPFFTVMRERRPFVVLKAAMSADGYISEAPGKRTMLTSAEADRHAHLFRAEVDAIAVGSETLLVDDPLLTARGAYRERPLTRVIFDRRLRTPAHAAVLSTLAAGPVMIMTSPAAAGSTELVQPLKARGAAIEAVEGPALRDTFERLADLGIESLLLEGGSEVHAAAWDEDLVDLVSIYVCPRVIGKGGVPFLGGRAFDASALVERREERLGPDTLIEGYVHGPR